MGEVVALGGISNEGKGKKKYSDSLLHSWGNMDLAWTRIQFRD